MLRISLVARETGLTKEVLRKWEDRYGFPEPIRDAAGIRLYPAWQVARLRELKRRIDAGERPSRVVPVDSPVARGAQVAGVDEAAALQAGAGRGPSDAAMEAMLAHDAFALQRILERDVMAKGLFGFVTETAADFTRKVGEAWSEGKIRVFEEHVYTSVLQSVLEAAGRRISEEGGSPRVLLTTVPGELHTLGIRMAKALFSELGANCLYLGAQTPLAEIAQAVRAYRIDLLGLSFSDAFPVRQIAPCLAELRELVPAGVPIWIGGSGSLRVGALPAGVRVFIDIADAIGALREVQAAHPGQALP
jgi:methylmalonyl-CoA mutase cobalamin-binding subunit